jgi:hypothetical protein
MHRPCHGRRAIERRGDAPHGVSIDVRSVHALSCVLFLACGACGKTPGTSSGSGAAGKPSASSSSARARTPDQRHAPPADDGADEPASGVSPETLDAKLDALEKQIGATSVEK